MLKKDEEKNKDERNEIIKSIFELSQRIRYAEIFNDKAIKIAGGMKTEIKSLEPDDKAIKVNNSTAEYVRLLMAHSRYFGEFKILYCEFEIFNLFVFELNEKNIISITTEPELGWEFANKIKVVIKKWSKRNKE